MLILLGSLNVLEIQPEIPRILDFLQTGLAKGLKVATLRVQVAALGALFNQSLHTLPWISKFLKAASRIQPVCKSTVPPWDLTLVLQCLTKPPFEPIGEIPIKLLTYKTILLVAITSARRIGELQALSSKSPYMSILDDRIVIRPDPAFLPKVVSEFHRSQSVVLPSFCQNPKNQKEEEYHTLDVHRCVLKYLEAMAAWRIDSNLFISFSGATKGKKVSSSTIARWLKQTISISYELLGEDPPMNLKAHSTRAISTSWAEYNNATTDQICRAAVWSSVDTFFRHYRLDVSMGADLAFGRKVLQSIVPP